MDVVPSLLMTDCVKRRAVSAKACLNMVWEEFVGKINISYQSEMKLFDLNIVKIDC